MNANMNQPIWAPEAWAWFKEEARAVHATGIRGDALWARLQQAMGPLYASADPRQNPASIQGALHLTRCSRAL